MLNNLIPIHQNGALTEAILNFSSDTRWDGEHSPLLPNLIDINRDIGRLCKQVHDPKRLLEKAGDKLAKYQKFGAVLIALLDNDEEVQYFKSVDPKDKLATIRMLLGASELPPEYHESLMQVKSTLPSLFRGVALSEHGYVVSALHYSDVSYGLLVLLPNEKMKTEELSFIGDIAHELAFAIYSTMVEKERLQAQAKIHRDLREKDVMMAEIHHRTKNNLQIVSGLLYLQSRKTQETAAKDVLSESLNRIQSMALIHDQLYQSSDTSHINFKNYIERIMRSLMSAYSTPTVSVQVDIRMDDILFNLDTAIPCGLIINELVSNSLKHAFDANFSKRGVIKITLRENDGFIEINVKDNGVGLPKNFQIRGSSSCGMEIVRMLAEDQLDGALSIENTNGAQFNLKFKCPEMPFKYCTK
jgi:two-component sensor histidine kinase